MSFHKGIGHEMMLPELQHKHTRLTETLYSALDAQEAARGSGSTMLVYLTEVLVTRVREEILDVQSEAERVSDLDRRDKAAQVPPQTQSEDGQQA